MFQYQNKVNAGAPQLCTPEIWDSLIDSPAVANTCAAIAALDPNAADYADRKQALKKRLPIIIPHAASFRNGKRISADAIPSGLAMLDVDHVDNPRDWFDSIDKQLLSDNKIYLVAITASGKGLRLIGERLETSSVGSDGIRQLESIEAAQLRIATALGIKEYDAVTKDLARASYVVPRDYILWIYADGLFSAPQCPVSASSASEGMSISSGLYPDRALPPHLTGTEGADLTVERSNSPQDGLTGAAGLMYRDLPYATIIQ